MNSLRLLLMVIGMYNAPSQAGHTCSYHTVQYSSQIKYVPRYTSTRYTTRCWSVWDFFRCTKYRQVQTYVSQREVSSHYVKMYKCCTGWSGPTCDTHGLFPEVTFCPDSFHVQATGLQANVAWSEPRFEEPYNYPLTVLSTHESGDLMPVGNTEIIYTATSTNNNKEASCTFSVFVEPPVEVPYIQGYNNGSRVSVTEGQRVRLQCESKYGNPPFRLQWTLNGSPLPNQVYTTEPTSVAGYENVMNKVWFVADREQHGKTVTCTGTKSGWTPKSVFVRLNVTYYPHPVVDYCPQDQLLVTQERVRNVSVQLPRFSDVFNDPLTVTCSAQSTVELFLGEHDVQCVAENQRTHRTSECSYTISLAPVECSAPAAPARGAALCGDYVESHLRLCLPMCLYAYDVSFHAVVPSLFACTLDGQWYPKVPPFNCSEDNSQEDNNSLESDRILPPAHYMRERRLTCASGGPEASRDEAEQFSTAVLASPYSKVCKSSNSCLPDQLAVICGSN